MKTMMETEAPLASSAEAVLRGVLAKMAALHVLARGLAEFAGVSYAGMWPARLGQDPAPVTEPPAEAAKEAAPAREKPPKRRKSTPGEQPKPASRARRGSLVAVVSGVLARLPEEFKADDVLRAVRKSDPKFAPKGTTLPSALAKLAKTGTLKRVGVGRYQVLASPAVGEAPGPGRGAAGRQIAFPEVKESALKAAMREKIASSISGEFNREELEAFLRVTHEKLLRTASPGQFADDFRALREEGVIELLRSPGPTGPAVYRKVEGR